jgi:hypothetical protein
MNIRSVCTVLLGGPISFHQEFALYLSNGRGTLLNSCVLPLNHGPCSLYTTRADNRQRSVVAM